MGQLEGEDRERMSPRWIAPITTWLVSEDSAGVTGRVFEASGRTFAVAEGWHRGPSADPVDDPTQIGEVAKQLVRDARLNANMGGEDFDGGLTE